MDESTLAFAARHGQPQLPARPVFAYFPISVQKRIKCNPLGAILYAAHCIEDREAIYRYIDSLPVCHELRMEIGSILRHEFLNEGRK